jgi:nicotinamidase/pyrazinamidase
MPMPTTKALLLLDLQRDFLAPDGRLPVAQEAVAGLLARVNELATRFAHEGAPVVLITNEFSPWDVPANLFRCNAALRGSKGAELDPRVMVASEYRFTKRVGDAFSNPALGAFLRERGVRDLYIGGVFSEACVTRTALGARAQGFIPHVLSDAVAGASRQASEKALGRLRGNGVAVTAATDLMAA